ncbi:MAG: mechanosensitive ion channel [Rhodobacteraceae bacterium]|nr:mechanosensitive ion channel [Paracoccaceae bacterium]
MKDYFYGFILLIENQYKVNDLVTIGEMSGLVERITLRVTVLRDFEGKVYFIPQMGQNHLRDERDPRLVTGCLGSGGRI